MAMVHRCLPEQRGLVATLIIPHSLLKLTEEMHVAMARETSANRYNNPSVGEAACR